MTDPYEDLAVDLISRTEKAVRRIGSLSADTGIQFEVEDAVDAVERGLPSDYPAPADSDPPRPAPPGSRPLLPYTQRDFPRSNEGGRLP